MANSRILVSGISGVIGDALLPALKREGYQTVRLSRGVSIQEEQIAWDPLRPIPPESVSGFSAVVHLAGESIVGRWTKAKKIRIRDSRVLGTRFLAEALAAAPQRPTVMICASAMGYYGDRGDEILREDSACGNGFLSEVCREWEEAAQPAANAGIRTVYLRIGLVLGSRKSALQKMLPAFRLGLGGRIGTGRQWLSWIDVHDLVGAILHILKNDSLRGSVNVSTPTPVTNAEFTKILASVLSRPAIIPLPAFAARLALGQMANELLLASQRVEPAKLLESGYRFQYPELKSSLENILKK